MLRGKGARVELKKGSVREGNVKEWRQEEN